MSVLWVQTKDRARLCIVNVCKWAFNPVSRVHQCSIHANRLWIEMSSVRNGIYVLGKAHMRSILSFGSFPCVDSETVLMSVWLTMALSRRFREDCPSLLPLSVSAGSPARRGDVTVYVFDRNQFLMSLTSPFYSLPLSFSVFIALSTVFYSINSPDNSPLSHSILPTLFLSY